MKQKSLGLPAGYRDLLFEEARTRRAIEEKLARIFNKHGYGEVIPSAVEYLDVYRRGNQHVEDRTVKFLDRDDHLLALRADFTPAIARIVASRLMQAPLPLRLWYSGSVFRRVDPKRGKYCEFGQLGAELIGENGSAGDIEILDLALSALETLGITGVQVHINHAGIFRGIVEDLKLDRASLRQVKEAIDRKDARGLATRLQSLDVHPDVQDHLNALSSCVGDQTVLAKAADVVRNPVASKAIAELDTISSALRRWKSAITYDLSEIDEMEYYSGVMFTFFHPQLSAELGRGGRYDGLLREFGTDLPAVGFSLSLDGLGECV